MMLRMTKMDVWMGEIDHQAGGLARTMRAVADFGVDLDGVVARRQSEKPGKGVVYITATDPKVALEMATEAGLRRAPHIATLKLEGTNGPGIGAKITKTIADTGVNLHGLTAAVIGRHFVCYMGFDSVADMDKAMTALEPLAKRHWPLWRHKTEEKVAVPA